MELSYWKSRWQKNNTGWHMEQVYPHLVNFWSELNLQKDDTVLVPLCGKSLDIQWLADKCCHVIGVDISQKAINELAGSMNMKFTQSSKGHFEVFSSKNVQLWVGDFLKLKSSFLKDIDAIYDKAALIALPPDMRKKYAAVIKKLCLPHTKILLNCFEYPQHEMNGPPFAVFYEELDKLYGEQFSITLLHQESILQQLAKFKQRGLSEYLDEKVYLLSPAKD